MREFILAEIRKRAADTGRVPSFRSFERETGIRHTVWLGVYWARWSDAVREAGLRPNEIPRKIEADAILVKLAEACRHFGRFPTALELRMLKRMDPGVPNTRTIRKRFGALGNLRRCLWKWAETASGHADILPLLGAPRPLPAGPSPKTEGFVYLVRSGAYCKIGRSDDVERRFNDIRVGLPEAAVLVHTIRTDDPPGIEAYWHRRFDEKRTRGEWFRLTAADIAAFKRRRSQ